MPEGSGDKLIGLSPGDKKETVALIASGEAQRRRRLASSESSRSSSLNLRTGHVISRALPIAARSTLPVQAFLLPIYHLTITGPRMRRYCDPIRRPRHKNRSRPGSAILSLVSVNLQPHTTARRATSFLNTFELGFFF